MKMAIAIRDKIGASIKNSANFQQLLKSKKQFDVILVESLFCDELLGLGHHFNAPVISISPTYESSEMGSFTAMPALKSFMPSLHNIYTDKMNFWERLHNMLSYWGIHYILKALKRSETQINYEMMFQNTKNPPSLLELKRNVSLIITNSGWNLTPPRPLMPHMIDVGGIAIKSDEVEPLPNDLQAFLDKSQFGAVYFSLGTIVNFTDIEHMIILHVFSQLSNVRFLVKGNEELLNLSKDMPNVLVQSWFPQKAILRHPNLKCFISHGGHNSVQESIFYGKPVIAMPFYFDHFMNTRWAVEKGYGIELPFNEMTSKNLKSAIENVLFNQRLVSFLKIIFSNSIELHLLIVSVMNVKHKLLLTDFTTVSSRPCKRSYFGLNVSPKPKEHHIYTASLHIFRLTYIITWMYGLYMHWQCS